MHSLRLPIALALLAAPALAQPRSVEATYFGHAAWILKTPAVRCPRRAAPKP
ncbi:MAG: hypothetical protein HYZ28_24550 [Myxococcales bacterium]|nr:hypothetical protein [Myxococcales bacterium]